MIFWFFLILGPKIKYLRTSDGDFKSGFLKKGSSIDYLVFQKFDFQSKEDKDIKFLAWKIVDTSDKTLKTFVDQALVQKIDQKQQALTKPDELINYVLDNSAGWYTQYGFIRNNGITQLLLSSFSNFQKKITNE